MDIEASLQPIVEDPEAFYREVLAKLAQDRGQDWVDANREQLRNNWEAALFILGL